MLSVSMPRQVRLIAHLDNELKSTQGWSPADSHLDTSVSRAGLMGLVLSRSIKVESLRGANHLPSAHVIVAVHLCHRCARVERERWQHELDLGADAPVVRDEDEPPPSPPSGPGSAEG